MLSADEYGRIYRSLGKVAADTEFDRQMRRENRKIAIAAVVLLILVVLMLLTFH